MRGVEALPGRQGSVSKPMEAIPARKHEPTILRFNCRSAGDSRREETIDHAW